MLKKVTVRKERPKLPARLELKVRSTYQQYKLLSLQLFEKRDHGGRINITKDVARRSALVCGVQ
ncbi:hypothetical protein V1478_005635 [Vespula squamosa]|uniref:Uncharacterized protein n=1 Tax=Vespula squamosa TaxID=30214 RepID=A0ABD2BAB3_VESSQ